MRLNTKLIIALGIVVVVLSILLFSVRAVAWPVAVAGLAIVWISFLPSFLYLWRDDFRAVPFLPMVGVFYLVFFGISVFVYQFNDDAPFPEAFDIALTWHIRAAPLVLVAAGLAVQFAVFVLARQFLQVRMPHFVIGRGVDLRNVSVLLWPLVMAHLVYRYFPQLQALPSIGQFLEPVGYVAYAGLLLLWFGGYLRRGEVAVLIACALPLECYARAKAIFLTDILLMCLAAMMVLWKAGKYRILAGLSVLSIVLLSFYGATTIVRDPAASRFANFYNAASAYVNATILGKPSMTNVEGGFVPFKGRFASLIQRTSHIWMFHRVYDWTPGNVPYARGQTYLPLLTSFIPRVLYPDKPQEIAGADFGVDYELVGPGSGTSVNIPWITELMMNFGPAGVVVGMAVFGILLASLDRAFNAPDIGIVEFAIGIAILVKFAYPESNFSVTAGSIPLFFISIYLYFYMGSWLLKRFRFHGPG